MRRLAYPIFDSSFVRYWHLIVKEKVFTGADILSKLWQSWQIFYKKKVEILLTIMNSLLPILLFYQISPLTTSWFKRYWHLSQGRSRIQRFWSLPLSLLLSYGCWHLSLHDIHCKDTLYCFIQPLIIHINKSITKILSQMLA